MPALLTSTSTGPRRAIRSGSIYAGLGGDVHLQDFHGKPRRCFGKEAAFERERMPA